MVDACKRWCLRRVVIRCVDCLFIRHIAGIRDIVGLHSDSVFELRQAFEAAVDDYVATCEKLNRTPQRPYSGKVMLRIEPSIHAQIAMQAEAQGKSLNTWAQEALLRAASA